ncbi:LLM class F420-dependent oxidoreductase [Paractinoplanes toevensis]|uniref:LLM class F420-dependent oxidoreductase n=1 Tax=Paractinoplanes toevensis TaxID=571911 RepID=A0A919WBW4_9ACTN|nr:LLM class F420-dependent oxidoreductase [Actinoplanes toevensis]GIM97238.1 LLM class F420-dependent oxidoreductase [Actinoplanes toevensis]
MNEFGRYGIWVSSRHWPTEADEIAAAARELEDLGFGSVWIGGSPPDDLRLPEAVLAATERLVVGTSIVDIWHSQAEPLAASHQRIRARFPGRFYLGIGSGHAPTAESLGQRYVKPLSRLREFLASLPDVPQDELMIAALGPKTVAAARDLTAGALPYLMPPSHTAKAREILGPDRLLIPEQKIFLGTDAEEAHEVARQMARTYLALPNYTNALAQEGLTADDLAGSGSDRFLDQAVLWGPDDKIRAGLDAHLTAGADHLAIQVLPADSATRLPRPEWRRLAGILGI